MLKEAARSSADSNGDRFSFSVPKGTERIVITFDTRSGSDNPYCSEFGCFDPFTGQSGEQEEKVGTVVIEVEPQEDFSKEFDVSMGHDKTDITTIDDPPSGIWDVDVNYDDDYNGALTMRVEATGVGGGGARPFITDNMLEITGLLLTIGGLATGLVLYKRRGSFLRRELHKIDETVHMFKDDVDECRTNLLDMHEHLKDLLVKRKIEDSHYLILEKRIDRYLEDLDTPGNRHAAATGAGAAASSASRQGKSFIIEEPTEWEPL